MLKKGGNNNTNDVSVLNEILIAIGYLNLPRSSDGKVKDYGSFGDSTKKAVIEFQEDQNKIIEGANKYGANLTPLLEDGKVGKATWTKLGVPLDSNGQPDRNSAIYKKLLEYAMYGETISKDEYNMLIEGVTKNNSNNQSSQTVSSSSSQGTGKDGNNVEKIMDTFGFTYDASQDIYISKVDAWQRKAGYHRIIDDISAVPAGMVIDCEPIVFDYNGKTYMIEMWKGQYDLSTGSEIGIYEKAGTDPLGNPIWKCAGDNDMLQMSYSLKKNGTEVYSREGKTWWLTGFKPGEFSSPGDLTMDISITFKDNTMRDAFLTALRGVGYDNKKDKITTNGNTASFVFSNTKTEQPWSSNTILNSATQVKNYGLVKAYNAAQWAAGVNDNSPSSINKILDKIPGVNFFF